MGLFEFIAKSRSGVYKNTSENRRLHRVGQRYGEQRQLADEGELIPGMPNFTKVNLKKYLSDKIKKQVDDYIVNVSTTPGWNNPEQVSLMVKVVQKHFNEAFDDMTKAQRAYWVELAKRLLGRMESLNAGGDKEESVKPEETPKPTLKERVDNFEQKEKAKNIFEQAAQKYGIEHGKPMSIDRADRKHANPKFLTLVDGSFRPYTSNCQTCVVAYELRKRGYDVEAKGVGVKPKSYVNNFQREMAYDSTFAFADKDIDLIRPNFTGEIKFNTDKGRRQFRMKIFDAIKEQGTYFLSFKNKGRQSGHIVVLEHTTNNFLLIDPQSNRRIDLKSDEFMQYLAGVDVTHKNNRLFRVNDLTFKPEVFSVMEKANTEPDIYD
jgi:hypothetical protein